MNIFNIFKKNNENSDEEKSKNMKKENNTNNDNNMNNKENTNNNTNNSVKSSNNENSASSSISSSNMLNINSSSKNIQIDSKSNKNYNKTQDSELANVNPDLPPPNSLPDLAKDLFSNEKSTNVVKTQETESITKNENVNVTQIPSESVLSKEVPKFDLELLKSYFKNISTQNTDKTSEEANIKKVTQDFSYDTAIKDTDKLLSKEKEPVSRSEIDINELLKNYLLKERSIKNFNTNQYINNPYSFNNRLFFEEFEKFLFDKKENISRVYQQLTPNDILNKMKMFHSQNTNVFSEIKDLEKLWLLVEQRKKTVNELSLSLETEILSKINNIYSEYGFKEIRRDNENNQNKYYPTPSQDSTINSNNKDLKNEPNTISTIQVTPFSDLIKKRQKDAPIIKEDSPISDERNNNENNNTNENNTLNIVPIIQLNRSANISPNNLELEENFIKKIENIKSFTILDPTKYFYFINGSVAKSFKEFISILETLNDEAFYHHVTPYRNDFTNWFRDVYKNPEFASIINNFKTKKELLSFLKNI